MLAEQKVERNLDQEFFAQPWNPTFGHRSTQQGREDWDRQVLRRRKRKVTGGLELPVKRNILPVNPAGKPRYNIVKFRTEMNPTDTDGGHRLNSYAATVQNQALVRGVVGWDRSAM